MSSFCKRKSYTHFFSKNITVYAIFNDQSFNYMLTNGIVSFEQLGPDLQWDVDLTEPPRPAIKTIFCKSGNTALLLIPSYSVILRNTIKLSH